MTEAVVTAGAIKIIRRAKKTQFVTTNKRTPTFLQAGCPSCHPTNGVRALKEKLE